jgi:hypothetical protein
MSNVVQEIQMLRDDIEELRRRLDKIDLYILVITKHLARADPSAMTRLPDQGERQPPTLRSSVWAGARWAR